MVGREQGEATAPRHDNPDILHQVVMGCDANAVAEPRELYHVRFNKIGPVVSLEAGEEARNLFGLNCDRERPRIIPVAEQPIKKRDERRHCPREIERA